ncbi:MAG: hypothetical protein KIS92_21055, partial [Planctomycetota bacterium]|nr:hypothetical protein [Planctomycetota bacterium]
WGLNVTDIGGVGDGKPRLAVVLSPYDLGCGWLARPLGIPCQHADVDALHLSANIVLWSLTR